MANIASVALEYTVPFAAVGTVVYIHQCAIRYVSRHMPVRGHNSAAPHMMRSLFVLIGAHLIEIILFALCYAGLSAFFGVPLFAGVVAADAADYLYFSSTTYSSLGLGDVQPTGPARFLAGVEALVGLIMIAWTAAFLFAETERADKL